MVETITSRCAMRPWIKLHTTTLDDVRLLRLNERQQLRYFQMYLLAGRLNMDGSFLENEMKLNETDIAIKLRVADVKQFAADFKALKAAGLIKANGHGPFIAAFEEEQVNWFHKQDLDRERQQRHRGKEPVTRDTNVTTSKSRNGHGSVTPPDQDQKKTKKKTRRRKEPPPTKPSSSAHRASRRSMVTSKPLVGGSGKDDMKNKIDSELEEITKQNPSAAETIRIMQPILRSSSLGKQKFITLMLQVATRILPREAKKVSLAALASVFADDSVTNKPVVAAYRIEHDQVNPQYFNPATWKVLPDEILKAAGIDDLDDYVRRIKPNAPDLLQGKRGAKLDIDKVLGIKHG